MSHHVILWQLEVIYKTKHIAVKHVYDCSAGFSNWQSGWSSAKKDYCCSHESRGCPGDHSGHLTKTVVTGVTEHEGPTYYHHHSHTAFGGSYGDAMDDGGIVSGAMDSSTMDDGGIVSGAMDGSTMDDGGIVSGAMDGSTMDDGGIVSGAMDGSMMDDGGMVSGGSGSFSHVSHVSSSWRDLKDESKEDSKETPKEESKEKSRRLQSFPEGDEFGMPGTLEGEGAMVGGEGAMVGGEGAMVGGEGAMVGGEGAMVGGEGAMVGGGGFIEGGEGAMVGGGGAIEGGIGGGGVIGGGESIPDGGVQGGMFGQEGPAFHHVIHHVVPMPAMHPGYSHTITHPAPIAPAPKADVHTIVHRHYGTVYRKIPVNHYVKVQMPQQPPIVNTVKIQAPPTHYDCGLSGSPDPIWTEKHKRWCCWKMQGNYCPKQVIDKNIYHTVVKTQPVRVPVPEPMPTHAPIVHTVKHTYHVPSPPEYVHVHVPGPTVVKHVTVPERVPVPVPEPPKVIDVKQPYTVHVPGPDHYVKVPVPSPPHVVTKYHTQWNTVVDHDSDIHTYDCASGATMWHSAWSHAKQIWCCSHQQIGCPGTWSSGASGVTHYHTYGHGNWPTDQMV